MKYNYELPRCYKDSPQYKEAVDELFDFLEYILDFEYVNPSDDDLVVTITDIKYVSEIEPFYRLDGSIFSTTLSVTSVFSMKIENLPNNAPPVVLENKPYPLKKVFEFCEMFKTNVFKIPVAHMKDCRMLLNM